MVGRVVAKLSPWEPIKPITLAITCQTPKIHGNGLVDSLGLPICLRVERKTHAEVHAGVTEEVAPHMTCEYRITVADDGLWEAVEPNNVLEEGAGHRRGCVRVAEWNKMSVLREPVHHCEQHAFAMDLGQGFDEVEGDIHPHTGRHRQGLQ
jgi:hypothetical protein